MVPNSIPTPPKEKSAAERAAAAAAPSTAASTVLAPAPSLAAPLAGQLPSEEREKLLAANRDLQSQVGMVGRQDGHGPWITMDGDVGSLGAAQLVDLGFPSW